MNVVCSFYNIPVQLVQKRGRKAEYRLARHVVFHICRDQFWSSCSFAIIGTVVAGNGEPYDHNTVRNGCQRVDDMLKATTIHGRYINTAFRNEYQTIHGYAVFELSKFEQQKDNIKNRLSVILGEQLRKRLSDHCKSTSMTKSLFAKNAILSELNRLQNGLQV